MKPVRLNYYKWLMACVNTIIIYPKIHGTYIKSRTIIFQVICCQYGLG